MTKCKLVAYYRVSTAQQGKSGLGLEAQEELVRRYEASSGCEVIASYTEVETGKGKGTNRPELVKALAHARKAKATLVIATQDRLARNVHFVSGLMESGVPFVCADSPNDAPFVLHMKAAIAEEEARKISERTRNALAAKKARGFKLGSPVPMSEATRLAGRQANSDAARQAYASLLPLLKSYRESGLTLQGIADRLNEGGHTTRTGQPFSAVQVKRILDRS